MTMNFIFFGTPEFAAQFLTRIMAHGFVPGAVVTNPDRPVGRKKIVTAPPVKQLVSSPRRGEVDPSSGPEGLSQGKIEILQPEKLDADFVEKLKSFKPDFFVVFAYNKIFRKNVLDIPRLGTIGVHPSFLPKYRGASPFQTALLEGESETGVTLYFLDEGVDSGPVLARSNPVAVTGDDTFWSLAEKLVEAAADVFIETVPKFLDGKLKPQPQDESQATFTKKFKTEDSFVAPEELAAAEKGDVKKAAALDRKIRALNPEPGVWTMRDNKRIKLLEAAIVDGALKLKKIQEEGQKPKMVG
jgi:methionyl-tRNA formyltransferase